MTDVPPLSQKMNALAAKLDRETGGGELGNLMHVAGQVAELRACAAELAAAVEGFYSYPPTVTVRGFLGAWARARMLWCDVSGEPLV